MKFRKKPVVIEAMQFDGSPESAGKIIAWAHQGGRPENNVTVSRLPGRGLQVRTLEGTMSAGPGWWIIKGVKGEFYPCKPDIFAATYEPVNE